jgi:DNA-binding winged helix-turn-helix (wHTH) protein
VATICAIIRIEHWKTKVLGTGWDLSGIFLEMRLLFGDCALDTDSRVLTRSGQAAHLTPKAYRLLEVLIEERPRALSKGELQERVWPGTFISEATLASVIAEIRDAIGDDSRPPLFVRTVHGFGYAFSGEARAEETRKPARSGAQYAFRLIWGTREVALAEGENILGREPDCTAWIDSAGVSRRHTKITVAGDRATIEDLDSKNGTYVRGRRLMQPTLLEDGDQIGIASVKMTFRRFLIVGSTKTDSG